MWKKIIKELTLPESYISVTLGFLVVLAAGLLMYNYFNKKQATNTNEQQKQTQEKQLEEISLLPTTHTVTAKETLWSIADKYYGSGYNWVTIAKENKISNPNTIEVGQKLTIVKAETIRPVADKISATSVSAATSYTVVKGDSLWKIALKEYGNGHAWTTIAKANNLVNPRLIHAGNVLFLPR